MAVARFNPDGFFLLSDGKRIALVSGEMSVIFEHGILTKASIKQDPRDMVEAIYSLGYTVKKPTLVNLDVSVVSSGKVEVVNAPIDISDFNLHSMTIMELLDAIEKKIDQRKIEEGETDYGD